MNSPELGEIQIFDVLKNSLSGELGVVLSVSGSLLDMRDKTGMVSRYKFGKHFMRVSHNDAVEFRTIAREAVKNREKNGEKKKRSRTVSAFLNKLAKKR